MADQRYFLEILGGAGFGNGDAGGGGGGGGALSPDTKAIQRELQKLNKSGGKSLGATLGIKLGVASVLKQSQVFTGFIGTIFQLMGALVDVILAPFLPILIPAVRKMAEMIPYVAKYAQAVFDFLDRTLFTWIRNALGILPTSLTGKLIPALSALLVGAFMLRMTGMWRPFWAVIEGFIGKPLWALAKTMFPNMAKIVDEMGMKAAIKFAAKRAIINAWNATGGKIVTKLGTVLDEAVKRIWTDGIKAKVWTPLKTTLIDPVTRFISAPFKTLWAVFKGRIAAEGGSVFQVWKIWFRGSLFWKVVTGFWRRMNGFPLRMLNLIKSIPGIKQLGTLGKIIWENLSKLWDEIAKYAQELGTWIVKNIPGVGAFKTMLESLWNTISRILSETIPKMIQNIPVVKSAMAFFNKKGLISGALKGARGLLGRAAGKAGTLGKGLKAIPILGAIAEAGFGGYQTYKDWKKYGAKAALGRAALTLGNVGAALVDPTGLASAGVSIGTNIAMDQLYKRNLAVRESYALAANRDKPDMYVQIKREDGSLSWVEKKYADADKIVSLSAGEAIDRIVGGGDF